MNTVDVYSLRFNGCRTVYPLVLIRPIGKYRLDQQVYFDKFLTDICSNGLHICCFIGDNPKRAFARFSKAHASYFPCEYCESQGQLLHNEDNALKVKKACLQRQKNILLKKIVDAREQNSEQEVRTLTAILKSINDSIKNLNRKNNNIVWPSSTQNGCARTTEKVLAIVERIENDDILSHQEAKGIVGRSLLLDIPYFNFVDDVVVEYLHCVCIGVVKRMVELTFDVGETRQRNTNRKLSSASKFNALMAQVKVFREFSRRARNLDFSVMKGQEFPNIICFFFILVIDCIEKDAKERRLWLLLAYMIRLCVIPDDEHQTVESNVLDYCSKHFYKLYEQLFNARNCTYNTHSAASHLGKVRVHGPLTVTSAFGFESFYGEMRHSFVPGTTSPLKQVMEKILLKRAIGPHCCKASIFFSPKDTAYESNCYIYTFSNKEYSFFKIVSINENSLECLKVGKYQTSFPETPTLNWAKVGVFAAGGISEEIAIIEKENVAGKVIRVKNYFLTCPNNVLEEK